MSRIKPENTPMLNAYPDSIGGTLSDIVSILKEEEFRGIISSFYILPSIFNTDLDRGFSVIDYELNECLACEEDLQELKGMGIDLKLDFILNHASVLSRPFQDILKNGKDSEYKDFFIDWNKFWEGCGEMQPEGYIQPEPEWIQNMFFRKTGLPLLMVRFPDGTDIPYWNTFYQEVRYPVLDAQDIMRIVPVQYGSAGIIAERVNAEIKAGKAPGKMNLAGYEKYRLEIAEYLEKNRKYLGQMDLNIKSPLVWEFYEDVLKKLSEYGAGIVRLDAFAYAPKAPGEKNFLNEPGTWELLEQVQILADKYSLSLLPEIHAGYEEKIYEKITSKGYMTYDFFLPGLIIDALERGRGDVLKSWADEIIKKKMRVVNMLGCHDGIPLLDLKGLISEERIQTLIDTVVERGGLIKNLHGQKKMYYQVNATYYSALGEDDNSMLLARALQLFMPGKPQIWYLDLFAGKNDYDAVEKGGAGAHKEINRTNIDKEDISNTLTRRVVAGQLELSRFRNTFPAFSFDSNIEIMTDEGGISFIHENAGYTARLEADLMMKKFKVIGMDTSGKEIYRYEQ